MSIKVLLVFLVGIILSIGTVWMIINMGKISVFLFKKANKLFEKRFENYINEN